MSARVIQISVMQTLSLVLDMLTTAPLFSFDRESS